MARKPNVASEAALQILKQKVRLKSGLSCTCFADMQMLHDKIASVLNEYLSVQTLSRFFGLSNTSFQPAAYTLLILSRYLGYNSFQDIEEDISHEQKLAKGSVLRFVASVFGDLEPGRSSDENLLLLIENIHSYIEHDDVLSTQVHQFMASTSFGRRFFFQRLVNIDSLDGQFGDALKDYLVHALHPEEQVFGRCLLGFRYFLTDDQEGFSQCYRQLPPCSFADVEHLDAHVLARFCAMQIFAAHLNTNDTLLEEILALIQRRQEIFSLPEVSIVVSEALILVKQYDEAAEYLQKIASRHTTAIQTLGMRRSYFELLKTFADFFAGRLHPMRVKLRLQQIRTMPFHFLSLNYLSIFINVLEVHSTNYKGSPCRADITHLINKTGFTYFRKLLVVEERESHPVSIYDN